LEESANRFAASGVWIVLVFPHFGVSREMPLSFQGGFFDGQKRPHSRQASF